MRTHNKNEYLKAVIFSGPYTLSHMRVSRTFCPHIVRRRMSCNNLGVRSS